MWTLFKVIRWILTGLALWWLCGVVFEDGTTAEGAVFGLMLFGQLVFWPLALLWGLAVAVPAPSAQTEEA